MVNLYRCLEIGLRSKVTWIYIFLAFVSLSLHGQNCAAAFGWDETGVTIQFSDLSTSNGGDIVSWFWDFDDGSTSTEQHPLHTFPEPDKYDVVLEIETSDGCFSEIEIRIEICVFTVNTILGACDPDGFVPIDITISDVYDNADEIDVSIDGELLQGSPFPIDQANPVMVSSQIMGNGLEHTLTINSLDIPTCSYNETFTVEDCSSDCFLSAMSANISNGATHTVNVGGNFFDPVQTTLEIGDVVLFQWIDDGHSTTSDATSGPDSWNSGVISGPSFEVNITNPGLHPYYCIPHGGPGGSGMSGTLIADCPTSGEFSVEVSFNASITDPAGFRIRVDGNEVPGSPFSYSGTGPQSQVVTILGDGVVHSVEVEDVADPTCLINTDFQAPDCGAAPSCSITASGEIASTCDGNNNVDVLITVTHIQPEGDNFAVFVNGALESVTPYDPSGETAVTISVPGNGTSNVITIEDEVNPACQDEFMITTPDCTQPCEITNLEATAAGGGGGPSGIVHTVFVEDFVFNPVDISISEGDVVRWEWTGQVAHTSTSDATTGPDSWASGLLNSGDTYDSPVLSEGVHPYYCEPHGAPGGVGMAGTIEVLPPCNAAGEVQVQVSFDIVSPGASGYEVLVDGTVVGSFDYGVNNPQVASVWVVGDGGVHDIEVRDVANSSCLSSTTVTTPSCGGSCSLSATAQVVGSCQTNNTVDVEVEVTGNNVGASFELYIDGVLEGSYSYTGGTTVVTVSVVGDGQSHDIEVIDGDDPACSDLVSLTTPDCTQPCEITNVEAMASGGGGPSGIVHTVLVEDFVFNPENISISEGDIVRWEWTGQVAHTATSDATTGPDSWASGLLNTGATYDSPVLSEGLHPYYCEPHGAPGGVGMAGTIEVLPPCNAAGEVQVQVSFDIVSPGANGYEVLVDGALAGSFDYEISNPQVASVWVLGDGGVHDIEVRDVDDIGCLGSTTVTTPSCGGSCSVSASAQVVGSCLANNTVDVEVEVTGNNVGATFELHIDGVLEGSYSYSGGTTVVTVSVTGDGLNHDIEVIDGDDPACSDLVAVTTPDCTQPCEITNVEAMASGGGGPSGIVHTVLVEDFVFNPENISISEGDIVRWEWTGQVAHTATSDATTGPDSWASGLLNTGATYDSPVLSEGIHPYYCEPHGAPGGVGMAGTIEVLPPCNAAGEVQVQVSFDIVSPGASGYEVLVDGTVGGTFTYALSNPQVASVWVIGDGGVHDIEVRDVNDNGCLGSTTVTTPSCGGSCSVSASAQVVGSCQANNTVEVDVEVTGNNVGATFELHIDGVLEGSYSYTGGTTVVTVSVVGDGQSHDIEVIDGDDPACSDLVSVTTPDCTQPCELSNLEVSFGMPTTHIIEVLDFEFAPKDLTISLGDTILFDWVGQIPHTATSDDPLGTNSFQSGLLSQGATYEVIPGAVGSIPYYCEPHGAPGGIGMAGTIEVLGNCENGQASGTLTFNQTSGGSGFNVYFDDSLLTSTPQFYAQGSEQSYSFLILGDGLEHTFRVEDNNQAACSAELVETVPDCSTVEPCDLSADNLDIGTCEDGSFILQATFSHTGQSDYYQILWDGVLVQDSIAYSQGTQTTSQIELSGTGTEKSLQIRDMSAPQCFAEWIVSTPDCGEPCLITTISEDAGFYPTIEVRDFDFFPESIEVFLGDTIAFIWTGEVPHTTTSDKVSGSNSWDSGILNEGDTFLIALSETGIHPYYCIPHGGPGGIGMAGTISVVDTCAGEFWRTYISFDVTQGSPLGYNYFVDGVQQNTAPIPYQNRMGTNELLITLPGDGNQHTVTVQDLETSFCAASIFITSGSCGAGCAVTNLEVNAGSQIRHQVEVRDFDYVPSLLEMRSGQNIDFNFTGSIPHTVTSDAISGPDSWDSGLLGMGDNFSLEINNSGSHPYYCIPHGGPGGIGMAASIEASPLCKNGKIPVRLSFEVNNGSPEGYNLFVDGERIGTTPIAYNNPNGANTIEIELMGDGEEHIFTVQDVDNPICAASAFATIENCQQDSCSLEGLEVRLASGLSSTVLVRDFDFNPMAITIVQGDTVRFFWEGEIPHTATSDDPNHPEAFNSGLLPQGSIFKVSLDSVGTHPYYCIPHGGPGGIGMAGTIEVEELCYNDSVFMEASFFGSTYPGQYEVLLDGTPLPNSPFDYDVSGEHSFVFSIPGAGQDHQLQITDADDNSCTQIVNFEGPDCSDPCIRLAPNFSSSVNNKMVSFTNTSQNATSFQWDFGDGSSSTERNPSHEFSENGTYTVCLTVEDTQGCKKEYCDKVTIGGERCVAAFEWENQGLAVNLQNTSQTSDPTVTLTWKISDGAQYVNQDNPMHTFSELGVYEICLVISGSTCVDSICQTLDLSNPCILLQTDFSFSPSQADPLSIDFTEIIQGSVTNRLWGFGDGTTSTAMNPTHNYQSSGVYTVCLLTQDNVNECSKSICKEIQVGTVSTENPVRHSSNFEVFPNPLSTGQPHLLGRGFHEIDHFKEVEYSIWDVQGSQVQSGKTFINAHLSIVPRLSPGFYLITVKGVEQVYLSKFIVND